MVLFIILAIRVYEYHKIYDMFNLEVLFIIPTFFAALYHLVIIMQIKEILPPKTMSRELVEINRKLCKAFIYIVLFYFIFFLVAYVLFAPLLLQKSEKILEYLLVVLLFSFCIIWARLMILSITNYDDKIKERLKKKYKQHIKEIDSEEAMREILLYVYLIVSFNLNKRPLIDEVVKINENTIQTYASRSTEERENLKKQFILYTEEMINNYENLGKKDITIEKKKIIEYRKQNDTLTKILENKWLNLLVNAIKFLGKVIGLVTGIIAVLERVK